MKRWWLAIVLLLSLGVNVGVLATIGIQRLRAPHSAEEPLPAGPDGLGPSGPGVGPSGPGPSSPGPSGPGPNFQLLADRLRLDGERRERFIEVQQRFFETARGGRQRLERLRQELRQELVAETPDRARAEAISREMAEVTGQLERALIANILDSKELLTPVEQRQFLRLVAMRLYQQLHPERPGGPPPQRGPWWRRGLRQEPPSRRP